MNPLKNLNRGITLIALVITIIVLLILAGISIATLTGENGILTRSSDAKIETRGASVEEARDLWKINQETDNYTESGTAQTLEELIADLINQNLLTEDEKDEILGNDEKGIKATGQVTIGSRTIIFLKPKDIVELIEGDYIKYPDKNENEILCRVLYNNKDYGVQIVTCNPLTYVELYQNYNDVVRILNDKVEEYRNPDYSEGGVARCLGTLPGSPYSDNAPSTDSSYKGSDERYVEDYKQLEKINACALEDTVDSRKECWLASRIYDFPNGMSRPGELKVRCIEPDGSLGAKTHLGVYMSLFLAGRTANG